MTTLCKPSCAKAAAPERLQENPAPNERDEIERLLEQIDMALDLLAEVGPSEPE
jgi:hypothetical protein